MSTHASKPPLDSWLLKLAPFITSPTNRVYPNGRQQIEVTVLVESRSIHPLKPEERASVRLMVRDRLGRFSPLPQGHEASLPWFFSHTRNAYLEYPGTQKREQAASPSEVYTPSFYVSAGKLDLGQSLETLYVGITRYTDEGQYEYVTDGTTTGFAGYVEVRTAEIPTFHVPGNYTFERTLTAGNDASDIFTWQYALAGANVQQPVVRFVSGHMVPAGMIQWSDRNPSVTQASNVGYAPPGESTFHYNPAIKLGTVFKPVPQAKNAKPGHLTIVLQGSNNIPYDSQSAINHNGPCEVKAIDVYGNEHQLEIRFNNASPQGRLELVLG
jgi:hypothetical protein